MSGYIPEDIINRVRESVNIVELVSRYLSLKKTGANYKALCPFHKEKTPSFTVSPSRQTFHCFGCGKGGNAIHFVMAMDRVPFPDAIRTLARDANIDIPENRAPSHEELIVRDEKVSLYEANARAAEFFAKTLKSDAGAAAREYVKSRGISDEMIERCKLGYSPNKWDALLSAARSAGIPAAILVKAGLALEREGRSGMYDRFRNRLMFPIFDTQERVIGFGARTMAKDDDVKYINTPETPIFSKGKNLYGLNWARKAIVDARRVTVVEGYTDVIMAHQHGVLNVVATLGTALTKDNIYSLRRFAERIDVVFDSDAAGQKAAERSMELFIDEGAGSLVAEGFDVRIAAVEGGKDPCEVIAASGPEPFTSAIERGTDVFTKKMEIAAGRNETKTVEGKTKAIDEILTLVALIPNEIGRELRSDAIIRAISDKFNVDVSAVRRRLNQLERTRRKQDTDDAPKRRAFDPAERGIIEGILNAPDDAEIAFKTIKADDISDKLIAEVYLTLEQLWKSDGIVNADKALAAVTDTEQASLITDVINSQRSAGASKLLEDCRRTLLRRRSALLLDSIKKKLEEAKASGDESLADSLNMQYLKLQREVLAS